MASSEHERRKVRGLIEHAGVAMFITLDHRECTVAAPARTASARDRPS
jgi:hypothetical protein